MISIKVVGSGCPTCQNLADLCQEIVDEQQIHATIEKITDVEQFIELGVYMTPGLIINDELVSSGKPPARETLTRWLTDATQ